MVTMEGHCDSGFRIWTYLCAAAAKIFNVGISVFLLMFNFVQFRLWFDGL